MLSVQNISKAFNRKKILKNISFSQKEGESIVFMGRNGAGKSTLFRIIARLMTYDNGSIIFQGKNLLKVKPIHSSKLFYLGHSPGMYRPFSAIENLNFLLSLRKIYKDQSEILDVLDQFGLMESANEPIGVYSEGMLQRLKIVCAQLMDWDMILIDEPFSNLDKDGLDLVQKQISFWKSQNKTISMILHNKNHAENFCDRILTLESGIIK